MYLNTRSCTASKAQLQSEKEKGKQRRGTVRGKKSGDVELLPCLRAGSEARARRAASGRSGILSAGQLPSSSTRRDAFVHGPSNGIQKTLLNLFTIHFRRPPRVFAPRHATFQCNRGIEWDSCWKGAMFMNSPGELISNKRRRSFARTRVPTSEYVPGDT